MVLRRATSTTRGIVRVGPWKLRLSWALKWQRAERLPFGPKKVLNLPSRVHNHAQPAWASGVWFGGRVSLLVEMISTCLRCAQRGAGSAPCVSVQHPEEITHYLFLFLYRTDCVWNILQWRIQQWIRKVATMSNQNYLASETAGLWEHFFVPINRLRDVKSAYVTLHCICY